MTIKRSFVKLRATAKGRIYSNTMKRLYLTLIFLTFSIFAIAREYKVYGPQGGLAMEVMLPDMSFRMRS